MKIKCVANSGMFLSPEQKKVINSPDYVREYLNVGEVYTVYGITLVDNILMYLIVKGESETPTFQPAEFFEIIDNSLPTGWYSNYWGGSKATWGYKELALDEYHASNLEERESEETLKVFFKRKFEIDEWEKNKI